MITDDICSACQIDTRRAAAARRVDDQRRVKVWAGVDLPDNNNPNVVFFSGGKDSTALLILMRERDIRIDHVVFFDAGAWDWPELQDHIRATEIKLKVKVEQCRLKKGFEYYMLHHRVTRGKYKGRRGYGWPLINARWCTARKVSCLNKAAKKYSPYNSFIGYSHSEKDRAFTNLNNSRDNLYFPLVCYKWGARINLAKCKEYGFYGDFLYTHTHRVSCFLCPLQDLKSLAALYHRRPELWARLAALDTFAHNSYYRGTVSAAALAARFQSSIP